MPTKRDELIQDNLPLVDKLVNCYLKDNQDAKHLRDDLAGEANLVLVAECEKLVSGVAVENIPAYLSNAIRNCLTKFAEEEPAVGPTKDALAKARQRGEEPLRFVKSEIDMTQLESPEESVRDLRDQVDAACETQFERDVIQLRSEGYTDSEVADKLQASQPTIARARKRIEARFDELYLSA